MPDMEELENPSYKYTSQIISSDGKPLGTYYPAPIPQPAPLPTSMAAKAYSSSTLPKPSVTATSTEEIGELNKVKAER